jgi:uncharacterized protein (DUF2236 family)
LSLNPYHQSLEPHVNPLQRRIVAEFESIVGPHDDPAVYGGAPGDPGLLGPDSISWEIHADIASVAVAGTSAIVIEILHPSVIAGVEELSSYRRDPLRRARTTLGYVLTTTFGTTEAASDLIARVKGIHGHINGTRPDGVPYRALDPELLAWVHTAIPWMIMRTYERFNRALSPAERDRYLAEQAVIGRMGGAEGVPETMAELDAYVARMRGQLAVTEQTRQFFDFLLHPPQGPDLPRPAATALQLLDVHAGMSIAPRWVCELTGFSTPDPLRALATRPLLQLKARSLRYAFGTPAYARLARARASGTAPAKQPALEPVA